MTKPKIYFGVLGAVIPFYRGAPPYSLQARTRRPLIHFHIFFYDVSILIHHHPCQCWVPVDVTERKGRERDKREREGRTFTMEAFLLFSGKRSRKQVMENTLKNLLCFSLTKVDFPFTFIF
jgi:hypothetical protein